MLDFFCKKDPLLDLFDGRLQASILRFPDERIYPTRVIEKLEGKKAKFRGRLDALSTFAMPDNKLEKLIEDKKMANIAGEKTNATDVKFGLSVMNGFLKGFNANVPKLDAHFKSVTKVSFSFENVVRKWIDNNLLGRDLKTIKIDKENASTAGFFEGNKLLVIDSIITSNDFSIYVEDVTDDKFGFEATAIQAELAKLTTDISVQSTSKLSLTFKGKEPLPFAFTTIELVLDNEGNIVKMPPYTKQISHLFGGASKEFEKTKVEDSLKLVELDFEE